jgi:hypothetical protein
MRIRPYYKQGRQVWSNPSSMLVIVRALISANIAPPDRAGLKPTPTYNSRLLNIDGDLSRPLGRHNVDGRSNANPQYRHL